jgi:flagellar motor switch protein FliN
MSEQALTSAGLLESFASEMATAVAALAGETTSLAAGPAPAVTDWLVHVEATGAATGAIAIALTDEDAKKISATVMGFDAAEVADDAVADTLREIAGQAIGALHVAPETSEIVLTIANVARASFPGPVTGSFRFTLPGDLTPSLVVGGTVELRPAAPAAVAAVAPAPVVELAAVPKAARPAAAPTPAGNLDLLLDIELPLAVRFGQTELSLLTLTRLGPGSVIDLHRSADEPVEVLVSGKVIARGEVVVVEGNYGVRVTEVVSTVDRIRSLGA